MDPFARSHISRREQAAREREKMEKQQSEAQRKKRMDEAKKARELDPNRDIGFPWKKKFYEWPNVPTDIREQSGRFSSALSRLGLRFD